VLQRRYDLIPNLVNTVKGYAKHEKDLFEEISRLRSQWAGSKGTGDRIKASQGIEGALSRLMVVVENYPNLKANENFLKLQDELAGTENRIAVERMRYNEAVKEYNVLTRRFPSNIIASIFNLGRKDVYFEANETAKTAPKVEF
jgi:LemA protein